jgi:hypothetical protein
MRDGRLSKERKVLRDSRGTSVKAPYAPGLRVRIDLVRGAASDYVDEAIRSAGDVSCLLCEEMTSWDRERFLALFQDGRHTVLGLEEVSVGGSRNGEPARPYRRCGRLRSIPMAAPTMISVKTEGSGTGRKRMLST